MKNISSKKDFDKQVIERLGGEKAISDALGYKNNTVHNWVKRGISKDAKIEHPEIFMPKKIEDVRLVETYLSDDLQPLVVEEA